jgi:hypothetical protein
MSDLEILSGIMAQSENAGSVQLRLTHYRLAHFLDFTSPATR